MRIYFAQVMDNKAYLEHSLSILSELEKKHSVYYPWRDEGLILEDQVGENLSLKTFNQDVENIKSCDLMIAYIDGLGADSGTCVEAGIAYALGKPVILYTTEFKYLPKGLDLKKWLYNYKNVTFANDNVTTINNEPMINNMLLGVSNYRIAYDIKTLNGFISDFESKIS